MTKFGPCRAGRGEGNGTPLQYSCLDNPMGGGAWWAVSMGLRRVGHNWATSFHFSLSCIGEGNGNPLQCSCLENPRDGGAWWAAVYGVTESRTRLKWFSSSRAGRRWSWGQVVYPGGTRMIPLLNHYIWIRHLSSFHLNLSCAWFSRKLLKREAVNDFRIWLSVTSPCPFLACRHGTCLPPECFLRDAIPVYHRSASSVWP